ILHKLTMREARLPRRLLAGRGMDILRSAKALTRCPSERPGRKRLMSRFLFTTLPTNDLGLLTRSLPIAAALASRGHSVTFCSPARAPSRLIADAGFQNRIPNH